MSDDPQYNLPLIRHEVGGEVIRQRTKDGYINATAMCKAAGREWRRYSRLDSTREFVSALEAATGIRSSELIQTLTGGRPELQGTWVHPQVAINLAQWLSPEFAVKVSEWVFKWLSGEMDGSPHLPDFVHRFHLNSDRVASGHFSVIGELFIRIYGRMERLGYRIPDKAPDGRSIRPDNSVGRRFSDWLKENYPDIDGQHAFYRHRFPDGYEWDVRQYPNVIWPYFIEFVDSVWIPEHGETYFKTRDPEAIDYIRKLIEARPKPPEIEDD